MAETAASMVLEMKQTCNERMDMRQFAFIFCALFLALVSCRKETPVTIETPEEPEAPLVPEAPAANITYHLDAIHDGATKAVKKGWETGDVIFVFFSGSAAPGYLEMKWDGSKWDFTEKNGLAIPDNQTGTMYAVYQPFGNDNQVVADEYGCWTFKDIHFSYFMQDSQPYTITGGQVSGTFNMSIPEGYVQFFLDDPIADPSQEIELREQHLTPVAIFGVAPAHGFKDFLMDDGAPMPGYVYDKENKAAGEQKGWLFSGVLRDSARGNETDYHFTLVKGGWQGSYYQKSFLNKQYHTGLFERRALKMPALDGANGWTEITDYKPIDLGMSVRGEYKRIYWCSRNLGALADLPSDNTLAARQTNWGDYYAWGATSPFYAEGHAYDDPCTSWKSPATGYNYESCPYASDDYEISKYTCADDCFSGNWYNDQEEFIGDNKTVLEPGDDAASVNLGGAWRMPSESEWWALYNTDSFIISYDSDKEGLIFTSKYPGYEGRSIFLPFGGARNEDYLAEFEGSDMYGYYWLSNLSTSYASHDARVGYIARSSLHVINFRRHMGLLIRPVSY